MGFFVVHNKPKRISGHTLQRIRAQHFRSNPLCVKCQSKGKLSLAEELDHIIPLHKGGTDTDDNRQGLCKECHVEKSKKERGHNYRPMQRISLSGWPEEI